MSNSKWCLKFLPGGFVETKLPNQNLPGTFYKVAINKAHIIGIIRTKVNEKILVRLVTQDPGVWFGQYVDTEEEGDDFIAFLLKEKVE